MDYIDARHTARMTNQEIAHYLELSPSTINRYKNTGKAPKAVIECLRMIGGQLPEFSLRNDFSGWSFGNGHLWSPAGERFSAGDVLAIIYDKQLIRSQAREIEKLKRSLPVKVSSQIIQFSSRIRKTGSRNIG